MCGIAGHVGGFQPGLIEQMNLAQSHRGPDGSGVFERFDEEAALGHVRLSILDLTDAAAQPMLSECGRYVLTYNGEIYNYRELRERIGTPRTDYRSSGDTEVLLRGLIRFGSDFVSELNGIFAFGLWDRWEQRLLLARDPLGVKPLYYTELAGGRLVFASELKAILCHSGVKIEPDPLAITQHLTVGHACGNRTAIRGIERLAPGSMLRWSGAGRTAQTASYWKPDYSPGPCHDLGEAIEALRSTTQVAVRRQMVSDVPMGAFLSGGLDSSLIVTLASRDAPELSCFTTTAGGGPAAALDGMHDDAPYAEGLARTLGLPLTLVPLRASFSDLLPRLIYMMDEPIVDPAVINCYLISEQARDAGIKVLLSGQGADELFGGYPRYRAMAVASCLDGLPSGIRNALARGGQLLPGARAGSLGPTLRRIRRLLAGLELSAHERFLQYCCHTSPVVVDGLMHPDFCDWGDRPSPLADCLTDMAESPWTAPDQCLQRDLTVYLPNHNLLYTDKMGMAAGVETRVPLLDLELVRLANSLPYAWKVSPRHLKSILRRSARGIVPDAIIDRPKAGFGAPFRNWLRNDLGELWEDVAGKASIERRGWFSYDAVTAIREQSQSGESDLYLLQWAIITLELWARAMLDAPRQLSAYMTEAERLPA